MPLTGQSVFLIWFGLVIASFWVPLGCLAMRFVTPRQVVKRYFREPHFSKAELVLLSHFPGSLLRTAIFMGATFQQRYRRGRQLEGYLDVVPAWYAVTSKCFVIGAIIHGAVMVLLLLGLLLWVN